MDTDTQALCEHWWRDDAADLIPSYARPAHFCGEPWGHEGQHRCPLCGERD